MRQRCYRCGKAAIGCALGTICATPSCGGPGSSGPIAPTRRSAPRIAPDDLTLRMREAMKQPASYAAAWRAALSYAGPERLAEIDAPLLEIASEQDVFSHLSCSCKIADDPYSRAQAIRRWIGGQR